MTGLSGDAQRFKSQFGLTDEQQEEGLIVEMKAEGAPMSEFLTAVTAHHIWSRSQKALSIPA